MMSTKLISKVFIFSLFMIFINNRAYSSSHDSNYREPFRLQDGFERISNLAEENAVAPLYYAGRIAGDAADGYLRDIESCINYTLFPFRCVFLESVKLFKSVFKSKVEKVERPRPKALARDEWVYIDELELTSDQKLELKKRTEAAKRRLCLFFDCDSPYGPEGTKNLTRSKRARIRVSDIPRRK